jgi:predicted DNA-binding transcriptional regulator YafY
MSNDKRNLLTADEMARELNVSEDYMRRILVATRYIPVQTIAGETWVAAEDFAVLKKLFKAAKAEAIRQLVEETENLGLYDWELN